MAPLHERARAKRAEAESFAPEVVLGARAALVVAREVADDVRQVLGLHRQHRSPCGFHVMPQSAAPGQISTFRAGCGRLSCRSCGPIVVANKIGAVVHMPITNDGAVTGEALGNRPVFVHQVANREFGAFKQGWLRLCRTFSNRRTDLRGSATETRGRCGLWRPNGHNRRTCPAAPEATNVENLHGDHAYVAFHLPERRVVVVSTFEVAGTDTIVALNDAEQVKRAVLWLGLSTYKVENDPIRVVVGKISSSQNLHLDPAVIARKAAGSSWIVSSPAHPARGGGGPSRHRVPRPDRRSRGRRPG